MRLYLSSYRLGDHGDRLLSMGGGVTALIVPNALDVEPASVRAARSERETLGLAALGLRSRLLDLSEPDALTRLAGGEMIWVMGGNVFVLRKALAESGADKRIVALLAADAFLYAGYSAGACVLAPDLFGFERVDDAAVVADPDYSGLAVLDRPLVPHVDSPEHPESERCDELAATFRARRQAIWALRDGDVLVMDGARTEHLHRRRGRDA